MPCHVGPTGHVAAGRQAGCLPLAVGVHVDRILRDANPADLSAQTPFQLETVLNLKTPKAPDRDAPQSLLVAADEVIE